MYPSPLHADPDALGSLVVSAPIVFLLCWLYNARRLGKFKRSKDAPPSAARKNTRKKGFSSFAVYFWAFCPVWLSGSCFNRSWDMQRALTDNIRSGKLFPEKWLHPKGWSLISCQAHHFYLFSSLFNAATSNRFTVSNFPL